MTTKTNGCGAMGCVAGQVLLSHSRVPCLECHPPRAEQHAVVDAAWAPQQHADHDADVMAYARHHKATEELPPGFQCKETAPGFWAVEREEEYIIYGRDTDRTRAEAVAKAWDVYRREHAPRVVGCVPPGTVVDSPPGRLAQIEALMNPGEGLAPLITRTDALKLLNMPEIHPAAYWGAQASMAAERLAAAEKFRAMVEADRQAEVDTRHTYGPESSRKTPRTDTIRSAVDETCRRLAKACEPLEVGDYVEAKRSSGMRDADTTWCGTVHRVDTTMPYGLHWCVTGCPIMPHVEGVYADSVRLLRRAGDIRVGDVVRWCDGQAEVSGVRDDTLFIGYGWVTKDMCTLVQLAPSTDSAKVDT